MSRFAKRRNIGLMIALALLVVVSGLGFATRSSNSSTLASSKVPAMPASSKAAAPSAASDVQNGKVLPNGFTVVSEVKHDVSPALRDIPAAAEIPHRMENENPSRSVVSSGPQGADVDTVIQKSFGPFAMPTPLVTWQGVNNRFGGWPPDTQGDVGPNNYVQFINLHFQIWDKAGNSLYGPVPGNTLWAGFGGPCQTINDGDPITLYDKQANRWLMSQFALPNYPNGPFYQCIAISTTGDPTGSYNRYSFVTSANKMNDYPHFGIWPDGYYMTANLFDTSGNWAGTGVYAFDRASMIAGTPATMQLRELPPTDWGGMLPSDMDGTTPPPAGSPNYFVEVVDQAWDPPNIPADELQYYRFHVDWVTPTNTTFTGPTHVAVAPFDGIACPNFARNCIPQPGTTAKLDAITDRGMYRLAYRNFGDHESLVLNHTVDVGSDNGRTGVRWYEVRNLQTTPTIYQQGTYAPDANSRWMGSAAMDRDGNLAIGFSVSSSTVFPSVAYAGRLASDPLGQLSQGEATLFAGTGSQTDTTYSRWGDYSALAVDPTDDCTFWYTNEYYATTSSNQWTTRIGSFKFPNCGAGASTPTPTSTSVATNTATVTRTATASVTPGGPTLTPTHTATATVTPCPITFSDVHPTDYFYTSVQYLACAGVISGYADGTFRPFNDTTRGQLSKIIVLAEQWPINTTGGPHFADVPTTNTFYAFVETAYNRGVISGYADGTFRPGANVTRGQLSKIVVVAEGWPIDTTGGPHFTDVPTTNPFYSWIETAYNRGIISGYSDGTFRWGANATRGQISKIVYTAVTQP